MVGANGGWPGEGCGSRAPPGSGSGGELVIL